MEAVDELELGRQSVARQAWGDAFESLSRADRADPLAASDLELLGTAAYMIGRDEDYVDCLVRAHHMRLEAGDLPRAVRCAFWIGIKLASGGEVGPASGWFSRAQRLLEGAGDECVEHGYLQLPSVLQHAAAGEWEAASATAARATELAERFGDQDLFALAAHEQGNAMVREGRVTEGFALIDEVMIAATAGRLSPIVTGLVYCSVIAYCQELYELRRAREWTAALTDWCEQQPQMASHTGQCLVHRAEIMQLRGAWPEALEEARRARERFGDAVNRAESGQALYRQAEIHRLRGELEAAADAYREASACGCEPQPGLALLRLAEGRVEVARAAIGRALNEVDERLARARLLPAFVEIALAVDEVESARLACTELEGVADKQGSLLLDALAMSARGALELAAGDARVALVALRRGLQAWRELEAPYETARIRLLMGRACRALGDDDTADLEFEAARTGFEQLGAAADLATIDSLSGQSGPEDAHGLTRREIEVLRLVAAGKSNREIASSLVISEHTVARHLQNIFAKLAVSSRTAASAFAFEHGLV